jgi:hypothetical protein
MVSIRKIAASTKLGLAGIALVAGVLGCGSSTTNNDQGASFSALGFFEANSTETPPPALAGFTTTLSSDPANQGIFLNQSLAAIGLENRLRNSFIRLTKVDCEYQVPGSSISVPPDSVAVSSFIPASPGIGGPQIGGSGGSGGVGGSGGSSTGGTTTTDTSSGTGGGNATGEGSKTYMTFKVISASIYSYLNNNRNALPELPFQVQIFCTATGVTNAGKTIETNPIGITAVMAEEIFTDTSAGTGSGGDVTGFDGGDSSNSGDGTTTVGSSSGATAPEGEIIPVTN